MLILFLVLFMGSAVVLLKGLGGKNMALRRDAASIAAMAKAKEALIGFAVMYGDNYGASGAGPGHLMCPDTNNDGLPDPPCGPNAIGRLPQSVTLPSGNPFPVSEHGADGIDKRFWYALSTAYIDNPVGVMNSAVPGSLTLDGQGDVVAVIIDPGAAFSNQNRPGNGAADYLEASNVGGANFVTAFAGDFNDKVLPIRRSELMPLVAIRVAEELKKNLEAYHAANGMYPPDQSSFTSALAGAPPWFTNNNWLSVTTYTWISADVATLQFSGCGIAFTLNNANSSIDRSQLQCNAWPHESDPFRHCASLFSIPARIISGHYASALLSSSLVESLEGPLFFWWNFSPGEDHEDASM